MFETLLDKLLHSSYLSLETTPGHGPSMDAIIEKIATLKLDSLIDAFSTTDNPLAKLKYNALFAAIKLQQAFNKPVLATMSMRDRNKIALQSDLLGANDFDIRAILALTGDPATISDQPSTKGVFEADSTLLLDMIGCFNSGMDYASKPFKVPPKKILPFAVMNAHAKQDKTLLKKIVKKIDHGAVGIITQPVYDIENAKKILDLHIQAKALSQDPTRPTEIILGLFPITKLRTAQFLTAHVPGVHVPKVWLDRLSIANSKSIEEEYKVGFEMSKTLFEEIKALHPKMHIMTANQFELAKALID